jgi:iron complex transport system substrate-binding protein
MEFIDQMNNTILLSSTPKRIVSLVPSITELLVDLGLETKIVGITKFCTEPNYLKSKCVIIGGTKNIRIKEIQELKPDFIIANKEENIENDIKDLKEFSNVWVSNIKTIEDNIYLINQLGKIFNKIDEAKIIISKIKTTFINLKKTKLKGKDVLYLIWKNPYMSIGTDTFIHEVLSKIGLNNCVKQTRYPIIELDTFKSVEYVFLSSEPYPFTTKELIEIKSLLPDSKIFFVDGTYFSWYGSRISKSINYFENLISKLD